MNFIVSDRESVEQGLVVRVPYVVVSIRDPGKRKARIPKRVGLHEVLHVAFHDAEPVSNMVLPASIKLMTEKHAAEIWTFVRRWEAKIGVVVVHCEQGMSRSPAVAAGLCKGLGGDPARFFRDHQPNLHVYSLMCECATTTDGGEHG